MLRATRTISAVNHKGGSGKTTTAVNLCAALAEIGRHVLVVDLDPQASASHWLGVADGGRSLLDVMLGNGSITDNVHKTGVPGIDLVPASPWMAGAERELGSIQAAETRLRRALFGLPCRWDYIVIDCPPALGLVGVNALVAAGEVLVPVEAHVLALDGLAQLLHVVDGVRERLNPAVRVSGIVACRVDGRTRHCQEVVGELRRRFGSLVHTTVIRENVRIAECPSFGQPITLYDTRSTGAADYRALAREIIAGEAA